MGMVHIKLKGMISRTEYKYNFYPRVKLETLRLVQRVIYHLNFNCKVNLKDLFTKLCVFSQLKEVQQINLNFILLLGSCPRGGIW